MRLLLSLLLVALETVLLNRCGATRSRGCATILVLLHSEAKFALLLLAFTLQPLDVLRRLSGEGSAHHEGGKQKRSHTGQEDRAHSLMTR